MIDLILILVLAIPIGLAARYVYKAKKRGIHCIGCPDGAACGGCCHSSAREPGERDTCDCENSSHSSHS